MTLPKREAQANMTQPGSHPDQYLRHGPITMTWPAHPPRQGEAVRGGEPSPRHNLLGNQDGQTSPRDQRDSDDMQPCTYCKETDHAPEECNREALSCTTCYVNGHNAAACLVYCVKCKTMGRHMEKDCPDFPPDREPLIHSSPYRAQNAPPKETGSQGNGRSATATTPTPANRS